MSKRKLIQVIASVFFAFILWVYVVTVVSPENDITITGIPVTFSGVEELTTSANMTVSAASPETVSVRFHGSRADLKQLQNNRAELGAIIDVAKYTEAGVCNAPYEIVLPDNLRNKSISLMDRSPRNIRFTISKLATKPVQIKGVFIGTAADGFAVGLPDFESDTVTISGIADVIDRVVYAQVSLDGKNVDSTLSYQSPLTLMDENGEAVPLDDIIISEDSIGVTLPVYRIRSLPLKVDIIAGGGATSGDVEVSVTPGTAEVYGEEALFEKFTSLTVASVDLSTLFDDLSVSVKVTPPEGIRLKESGLSADVNVYFKRGLTSETYRVQSPLYENLSVGFDLLNGEKPLTVTLRGSVTAMEKVDPEKLRIFVDLSSCTKPGDYFAPIRVEGVPDGVGIVGEQTAEVTIVEHRASDE